MSNMFASNNCSKKYMKICILLLLLFCFTLSCCTQSVSTFENPQSDNMNTNDGEKTISNKSIDVINSTIDITDSSVANDLGRYEFLIPFPLENYQLKDFPDNDSINLIENESIKKNVINVLSYIYNYNLDINTIEIDEDESKEWFSVFNSYKINWNISKELDYFARANKDLIVSDIDENFMIKPHSLLENNILKISVPVYDNNICGNSPHRITYDLVFKKIDGTYKLIGITKESFLTQEKENVFENQEFFETFEGNRSRAVAYKFFRAYIQNDIEEVKLLMENPDDTEFISYFSTGKKRTMDDVYWLVLKRMGHDPLTEIVYIEFEFGILPNQELRYFGVRLVLKDDEWKVLTDGAFGLGA